jgi:hypothetical protein
MGVILFLSTAISCFGFGNKEIIFRPATLTVLDAETGHPLEGLLIKVTNATYYLKRIGFIESEPIITYYLYTYETDAEGRVEIPQFAYKHTRKYFLFEQLIIVNLDVVDKSKKESEQGCLLHRLTSFHHDDDRYVFRPMREYKTLQIISRPSPMPEQYYYQLERTKLYLTTIFNGREVPDFTKRELRQEPRSLFTEHEDFTFYLERFLR